jgi:hypothetical protein
VLNEDLDYRPKRSSDSPGSRSRPPLIDAKIVDNGGSWWLMDAFRGH